ncbi:virion structural protein [Pseudomonas phage PhiPA3]|uniref:Virion structural protein n=1 Tax=Pseudomonas phage PhiPA3 TaxID=998086 RepID=F8SJ80_BPPA3|nr:virion structural protein [Pseudomonas phage PhiPA3]AEH03660.1 virion structural protein [Pseudomonas phage PhiPA3]
MSYTIHLKWVNPNGAGVTVNLYRSTSNIDRSNPGTPYVTFTNGETTYDDTNVTFGLKYYYMWESVKGTDVSKSKVFSFDALPFTGPGPQKLLFGNVNYGYYGSVNPLDFISNAALITACGQSWTADTDALQKWHKFSYKGKTIYVPDRRVSSTTTFTWLTIYNAGLMFGDKVPTVKPTPLGAAAEVPQNKRVTIRGYEFIVSCPTGIVAHDADPAGYVVDSTFGSWANVDSRLTNSAVDMFIMPLSNYFTNNRSLERIAPYIAQGNLTWPTGTNYVICREYNGTNVVFRDFTSTASAAGKPNARAASATVAGWYPILEMVPINVVNIGS